MPPRLKLDQGPLLQLSPDLLMRSCRVIRSGSAGLTMSKISSCRTCCILVIKNNPLLGNASPLYPQISLAHDHVPSFVLEWPIQQRKISKQ